MRASAASRASLSESDLRTALFRRGVIRFMEGDQSGKEDKNKSPRRIALRGLFQILVRIFFG
jgi:hypothetical protein